MWSFKLFPAHPLRVLFRDVAPGIAVLRAGTLWIFRRWRPYIGSRSWSTRGNKFTRSCSYEAFTCRHVISVVFVCGTVRSSTNLMLSCTVCWLFLLLQSRVRSPAVVDGYRSGLCPSLNDIHQCRCCAVLCGDQEVFPRFTLHPAENLLKFGRPPGVFFRRQNFLSFISTISLGPQSVGWGFDVLQHRLSTEMGPVRDGRVPLLVLQVRRVCHYSVYHVVCQEHYLQQGKIASAEPWAMQDASGVHIAHIISVPYTSICSRRFTILTSSISSHHHNASTS